MIANHQSTLDICVLACIWILKYTVVIKRELLFVPGIGSLMWFSRYLSVDRRDKESGRKLMRDAAATLKSGKDILWFPEGTRNVNATGSTLGPFKPGAFLVAVEQGAHILPISMSGARQIFPNNSGWPQMFTGTVRVRIHPSISSEGKTVDQLIAECRSSIESGLRECDIIKADPKSMSTTAPTRLDKEG